MIFEFVLLNNYVYFWKNYCLNILLFLLNEK